MKSLIPALLFIIVIADSAPVYEYDAFETCHPEQVDVTFLIDGSGSIKQENFDHALAFVAHVASQMVIDQTDQSAQVAFVKFTDVVTSVFNLKKYHNKTAMIDAIQAVVYNGGGTHIGDAIKYVVEHEYVSSAGDRPGAADVLIVLTDGQDAGSTVSVATAAAAAQRKNIVSWAIGVGPDAIAAELLTIANGRADHVKQVDNYLNLTTIYESICNAILNSTQQCLNNGIPECLCPPGWTGAECETAINRCPPSHVSIVDNSRVFDVPMCGLHGVCHYAPITGSSCVCKAGWTGQFCDIPIPGQISISHRCLYTLPGNNDCQSGDKCVPDNLNCVLQACANGIGWCLPAVAADQIFDAMHNSPSRRMHAKPPQPPVAQPKQAEWVNEAFGDVPSVKSGGHRSSLDCQHGGSFHCICPFGFHGDRCGVATNWCLHPPPIISGGHQTNVTVCGPHGTCHYDSHSGAWCVCDPGWTGRFCNQPIPDSVTLSHRCRYNSATDTTCPATGGPQKCVPDNLNCVLQHCTDNIGWCLPAVAAGKMLDTFCQHRTSAACPP